MKRQRHKNRKRPLPFLIFSLNEGGSRITMGDIADLYFWEGMRIADVTYGAGSFWRDIDTSIYDFQPSDLKRQPNNTHKAMKYDFRHLPYSNCSFDCGVIDPPFGCSPLYSHIHEHGRSVGDRFGSDKLEEEGNANPNEILLLYRQGIRELHRILRHDGLLIVKAQDQTHNNGLFRMVDKVADFAESIGFKTLDCFGCSRRTALAKCHQPGQTQRHSRKNYSMFLVFEKRR